MVNTSLEGQAATKSQASGIRQEILAIKGKTVILEGDLDAFSRKIEEKNLTRRQLIKVMKIMGKILKRRPEEWLHELGGGISTAARLRISNDQYLEHSLPDNGTRTLIVNTLTRDFHHSLVIETDEKNPDEKKGTNDAPQIDQQNDLEQSGFFQEEHIPEESSKEETPHQIPEEETTLSTDNDPRLATLERLMTTEETLARDPRIRGDASNMKELTGIPPLSFIDFSRTETFDGIDQLLHSVHIFFHEIHHAVEVSNPGYENDVLGKNTNTLRRILHLEKRIQELQEEFETFARVIFRRRRQAETLQQIAEELDQIELSGERNQYTSLLSLSFLSQIRDLVHEQRAYPEEIQRIQKELSEISEELASLPVRFPEGY